MIHLCGQVDRRWLPGSRRAVPPDAAGRARRAGARSGRRWRPWRVRFCRWSRRRRHRGAPGQASPDRPPLGRAGSARCHPRARRPPRGRDIAARRRPARRDVRRHLRRAGAGGRSRLPDRLRRPGPPGQPERRPAGCPARPLRTGRPGGGGRSRPRHRAATRGLRGRRHSAQLRIRFVPRGARVRRARAGTRRAGKGETRAAARRGLHPGRAHRRMDGAGRRRHERGR
jgi:hypothetical protein